MLDNRHSIARPYWARPGFALFAKKAADEEEFELGDEDDEDEDDDDEDEEQTPEQLKDALAAAIARAEAAEKRATTFRTSRTKAKSALRQLQDANNGKPAEGDDKEPKVDAEAIRREATEAATKRGIAAAARAELKASGVDKAGVADLVRLLDLDELDMDDDGEVDGLDEAIEELRTRHPSLFTKIEKKRKVRRTSGDDDASRGKPKDKRSASQKQADFILGKK